MEKKTQFRLTDLSDSCNSCENPINEKGKIRYNFPAVEVMFPSKLQALVPFCSESCKEEFIDNRNANIVDPNP